jgi:hypothetical protein
MSQTETALIVGATFGVPDLVVYNASRLHGYFNVGLSPTEAAQALFGPKH